MNEFIEKLYKDLTEDLELIHDLGGLPVKRLSAAVSTTAGAIYKLRNFIGHRQFAGVQEEIHFYKTWRPLFMAEQYYALEKFTLETQRPLGDPEARRGYEEAELGRIAAFFERYRFLYAYYRKGRVELDELLFLGGGEATEVFAKFIAFERLEAFIRKELEG